MPAREAGALYMECAGAFGASKLVDIDGFDAASDKVIAAGLANCAGQALFAGTAAEPRSDDTAARAFQNVVILRELRGSLHLVAVVASGLSPETAHRVRRGMRELQTPRSGV